MIFTETGIGGAWLIEMERLKDERGVSSRAGWEEFEANGLNRASRPMQHLVQPRCARGTARGLHYQAAPHKGGKAGSLHGRRDLRRRCRPARGVSDVPGWFGTELSAENRHALYVPVGRAHGFLTLTDDSEVSYQISEPYVPEAGRGFGWDDPAFEISWPLAVVEINRRDATYPDFQLEGVGQP